jgi:hypothetical protein
MRLCRDANFGNSLVRTAKCHEMRLRRAAGSLIVRPGLDWIPRRQPSSNGPPRTVGALGQTPAIMLYRNVSAYFTRRLVARLACATLHGQKAPTNRSRISAWDRKDAMPPDRLGQFTAFMSSDAGSVGLATSRRCNATAPLARPFHCAHGTYGTPRGRPGRKHHRDSQCVCVAASGLRPGVWGSLRPAALPAWASMDPGRCNEPGGCRRCSAVLCMAPSPRGPTGSTGSPQARPARPNAGDPARQRRNTPGTFCQAGGNRRSPCFEWPQGENSMDFSQNLEHSR